MSPGSHQRSAAQPLPLASLLTWRRAQRLQATLRRTRQLLDESNERFAKLADNLPVACLYIDAERRFRFINKTYQRWHGLPESSFKGRLMADVWDENWYGSTKTLDVTVGRLRQKLDEAESPDRVVTVRGVGFRMGDRGTDA